MAKPKPNPLGVAGSLAIASTPPRVFKSTESTKVKPPTKINKPTKSINPTMGTVGRPRRDDYKRLHITLSVDAATYLEEAWRTHRTADGGFVDGPSGFIQSLLEAHRSKS